MNNSSLSAAERSKIFQEASEAFLATDSETLFSHKNISDYLNSTQAIGWTKSNCLIALSTRIGAKFGWEQTCQLFELILQGESTSEQIGTYIAWQAYAIECLSEKTSPLSKSEHSKIFQDTERILGRALAISPSNPGLAASLGLLYMRNARYFDSKKLYLQKALGWFKKSEIWSEGMNDEDDTIVCLGIATCHFDLEEWSAALAAYKRLDLNRLREEMSDCEIENIVKRLRHCQSISS